jgi:hypothetical protein
MSEVHIVSTNIGALSNATRAIFKVPAGHGGITILEAKVVGAGAGTSWLTLNNLGAGGTASTAIIGTGGTAISVANVPQAITLTAANVYVDAGSYVGFVENNVGACNTVTIVDVAFKWGK